VHGWEGKLHPLASIQSATPDQAVGISDVSCPLPIARKVDITRRNTSQKSDEISRFIVIGYQLSAPLFANSKLVLAVFGSHSGVGDRSGRQLHRRGCSPFEKVVSLPHRPDVANVVLDVLKDVISSIRGPAPAALAWRVVPSGQYRAQFTTVYPNFPKRILIHTQIVNGKP
jgi:hypothetical protein